MNVLVTGGAGFIGSALSKRLVNDGHEVIVLDNFNDYYNVSLKKARVENFLDGIKVIEGDIRDTKLLQEIFSENKIDAVCHLAAMAGVRYSVENPSIYVDVNVQGFINLLEVMVENDCKKIVFASSSSVYGNSSSAPFKEEEFADKPESVYGATKRTGEIILHTYYSLYGVESISLRFFTVYGPWSRPDMAMLKFAKKITNGESIDIYNDGNLQRDFTYIDDIVNGFVLSLEKINGCEILNLGNGQPVGLMEFVSLIEEGLGVRAKKVFLPMQPGDVYETFADTTKASKFLGFEAKTSIDKGVTKFVDWFKSYSSNL